jgi:TrmH family RNA methyltransferase
MPPQTVRSRRNAQVQDFRSLDRDPALRDRRSVMLAEGVKVLESAERAGVPIESVLYSDRLEKHRSGRFLLRRLQDRGPTPIPVTATVMDYIYGGAGHQGIVAILQRPPADLETLLEARGLQLLYFAIGIQDPGNIGAVIRAADAVGGDGVLLSPGCADPFGRRAVRASMGSVLRVPVLKGCDPAATFGRLHGAGVRSVATDPHDGRLLWRADLSGSVAIVLGAEGEGLPLDLLGGITERVRVPMRDGVESLNVAATACLLGYEIYRRRTERQ